MGANKVATKRYRGKGATGYEAKRAGTNKWKLEDEGVRTLLPKNIRTVLDVPVGTGRFWDLYVERGIMATGLDTSEDMLNEAAEKGMIGLRFGDIRNIPFDDKSFDAVVCIRLMAWFEPDEVQQALREMARVSNMIIVNIRTNEEESFCKGGSLWNHYRPDFYRWITDIGFRVDQIFNIGAKGNDIYRLEAV